MLVCRLESSWSRELITKEEAEREGDGGWDEKQGRYSKVGGSRVLTEIRPIRLAEWRAAAYIIEYWQRDKRRLDVWWEEFVFEWACWFELWKQSLSEIRKLVRESKEKRRERSQNRVWTRAGWYQTAIPSRARGSIRHLPAFSVAWRPQQAEQGGPSRINSLCSWRLLFVNSSYLDIQTSPLDSLCIDSFSHVPATRWWVCSLSFEAWLI